MWQMFCKACGIHKTWRRTGKAYSLQTSCYSFCLPQDDSTGHKEATDHAPSLGQQLPLIGTSQCDRGTILKGVCHVTCEHTHAKTCDIQHKHCYGPVPPLGVAPAAPPPTNIDRLTNWLTGLVVSQCTCTAADITPNFALVRACHITKLYTHRVDSTPGHIHASLYGQIISLY